MAAIIILPSILIGCVTPKVERNLAERSASQKDEFSGLLEQVRSEQATPLTWKAAYQRMEADNLALRQSHKQLQDAGKLARRQWLGLVPRVVGYMNIGTGLSSVTNLETGDLNSSLTANFNIPNPFEFHASLYAAALQKQNAVWSNELDKRRAFAQLYSAFIEAQTIREEEAALERRNQVLVNAATPDVGKRLKSAASEVRAMERRRLFHRLSVNQLLNTPGSNWSLIGSLPRISYRNRYQRMNIGEDFGKLALNLQAIQIEGAILSVHRVKFQQWPSVNFGLSNPPLYTSNSDAGFSSDELLLFSGASKSMDLTDIGGLENIRDAEERLKFTREQLRLRTENELTRVISISSTYGHLLAEERRLERDIKRLGRPDSAEPGIVLKDLERRADLEMLLIENRRQIQQLDLQFLIWDETFWKS